MVDGRSLTCERKKYRNAGFSCDVPCKKTRKQLFLSSQYGLSKVSSASHYACINVPCCTWTNEKE